MFESVEPESRKGAEQRNSRGRGSASALSSAIGDINERQQLRLDHELAEYGRLIADTVKNNSQDTAVLQGLVAEAHHTGSYNVEAAVQGDLEHNARLARPGDKTTDVITEGVGGNAVRGSQLKFYRTPEETASSLAKTRYAESDVDKVVPKDQLEDVVRTSKKRAAENRANNPELSENYEHTARSATDHVSHPDKPGAKSVAITRTESEKITERARRGERLEHPDSSQKMAQLQKLQYANAAKAGAISGAVCSTASEVIRLLQRRDKLSQKDLEQALCNVLIGTAKGAGNALLTTGVQHAGRAMSKKAVVATVGKSLAKGNVATLVTSIATQFGKDVYRMANGEIDAIEMAESTINGACQGVAGAMGYGAGSAAFGYVVSMVGTKAASASALGLSMGMLGPVVAGVVGSALAAMAAGAYIENSLQRGAKVAVKDLEASFDALQCGKLDLVGYAGEVSKMSELRFRWDDLLPLRGTFAVLGEYKVRKRQIEAMDSQVERARADISKQERKMMRRMRKQYEKEVTRIEAHFSSQRRTPGSI